MPYTVFEAARNSPSWTAYAGWMLLGSDRVVARLPTHQDALTLACQLNLENGGARAAWNNSKQHLNDFVVVFTTDDRFKRQRRYYIDDSD